MRFDLLNQQISPHVMTVRPCPTPPGCQWRSCTYLRTYVRPRPTATLRMREGYSNSAVLAGFRNQLVLELFVSGSGNVPNTERKRLSEETGMTQATGPRQAC